MPQLPLLVSTSSRSPAVSFPVFVFNGILRGVSWGVLELYRVPLARVSWRIPLLAAVSLLLCGRTAARWRVSHLVPTPRSSAHAGLFGGSLVHGGRRAAPVPACGLWDGGGCRSDPVDCRSGRAAALAALGELLWRISGRCSPYNIAEAAPSITRGVPGCFVFAFPPRCDLLRETC